jgi:cephalosporin hydroxylase
VILYASLLELIGKGEVVAVDLNLFDHVAAQIMAHPFSKRIHLYKGSSTDDAVVTKVVSHVKSADKVMVLLDSNHTHQHVLAELRIYAPLVTKGQFLVVCDTHVEDLAMPHRPKRPWGKGNNPKTAMLAYLETTDRFQVDPEIENKLLMTFAPGGYLRCVR